ncbi:Serine/threonine-protein kinase toxin HipA [Paraburkholderia ultramafica]|uniref:Serine/threonine-protein kinase toxin HipA n=1 Tax=Paraburkholderia ultramafica TaxID=1544867 RepID=A0A6S7C2C0_9BURK|nr:type II toxin-antitoxin system HipA family toxin [Paraburkholderia ultramafica]CAB3799698.1 Serine/threonine-protein kinase toxin HipA [Paraburkholderia ultramafica]
MVRSPQPNRLNLWMNGLQVGYWETTRNGERLVYRDDWIDDPQGRPLSLSLPFTPGNQPYRGEVVADYFDNLLPDSEPIRRRIATRYRTGSTAPFALLAALGRDCVGALQMLPPDEAPTDLASISGRELSDSEIARLLRGTTSASPLGQHDPLEDLRLSIAGAQEKTALLRHHDRWLLPEGSTPTTHIFKLPLGLVGNMRADMRTSVENEWLCSQIVAAYGLPVARCEIGGFEEQKVLIVERFDRRPSSDATWIVRLPQEDMCQATATSALHKYEADGGPGIEAIMEVLSGSARAAIDRRNFFTTQMIFWLLAATDGHAKNFSIAHLPGNRYESTPLYDVLSAHPIIGAGAGRLPAQKVKLAMALHGKNVHYLLNQIQRRHWIAEGQRVGFSAASVEAMIGELTARTDAVIDEVSSQLPADFPMDVAEAVFDGMRGLNRKLARSM